MKKMVSFLLIGLLVFGLVACGGSDEKVKQLEEQVEKLTKENEELRAKLAEGGTQEEDLSKENEEDMEQDSPKSTSEIQKYTFGEPIKVGVNEVIIYDAYTTQVSVYGGGEEDAIVLVYKFKNNSDETVSFDDRVTTIAFQDGIGLNKVVFFDGNHNNDTSIRPGAEIDDIHVGYYETKSKNPIELELYPSDGLIYKKDNKVLIEVDFPKE